MMEQMTIWEYLDPKNLENITEEEMAEEISNRTGLKFKPDMILTDGATRYEAKHGKLWFEIHLSRFEIGGNERFVGVGYRKGNEGGGGPVESIDAAVRYFKGWLEKEG